MLSPHSQSRFINTAHLHGVPADDFAVPIMHYMSMGLDPGSFFCAILANDLRWAMTSRHSRVPAELIRAICCWLQSDMPSLSHGSIQKVNDWMAMSDYDRRKRLELHHLVFTKEEELILAVRGDDPKLTVGWNYSVRGASVDQTVDL